MKKKSLYIGIALFSASTLMTQAQNLSSGYFNDGYIYRHEMNPAFDADRNYISLPGLGNLNISLRTNLGIKDVLFNRNGKTVTFMNKAVTANEFLKNVNDKNRIGLDSKIQILGAGFKGFGGYNTISINIRENIGINLPGSLLRLAKEGPANKTYDISNFKAHADAYAEIALGHSRSINDQWRVGGKLKFLLGGANVDAEFKKAQLELAEEGYTAQVDAEVQASIKGLQYQTETTMRGPNDNHPHTYVNDLDVDNTGLNGFGLAVDLGAEFKLNDEWAFSASLLDLGFINWNNNMVASTNGLRTFNTDDYIFNTDDNADNSFDNEIDNLTEGLANLYELQDMGDKGSRSRMLGATLNLGAEYTLPVYNKLKFGIMNTTRIMGAYSWTDFRLSANIAPCKIFSASANISEGTYGFGFGWMLDFHPKGFGFFLGMDHCITSLAKQGVPLTHQADFSMGINIPF